MSGVKWAEATNRTTGISNESINSGARFLGGEIDNSLNKDRFCSLELIFTHGVAPEVDRAWSVWIIPAPDGTNYGDGDASVESRASVDVAFLVRNVTDAQRPKAVVNVPLPPYKFKLLVENDTDQNATGVTALLRTYNEEITS